MKWSLSVSTMKFITLFSSLVSWYPVTWKYLEGALTHSAVMASYSFDKFSTQKHPRRYKIRTSAEGQHWEGSDTIPCWELECSKTIKDDPLCASTLSSRVVILGTYSWKSATLLGLPDEHKEEENQEEQDRDRNNTSTLNSMCEVETEVEIEPQQKCWRTLLCLGLC